MTQHCTISLTDAFPFLMGRACSPMCPGASQTSRKPPAVSTLRAACVAGIVGRGSGDGCRHDHGRCLYGEEPSGEIVQEGSGACERQGGMSLRPKRLQNGARCHNSPLVPWVAFGHKAFTLVLRPIEASF